MTLLARFDAGRAELGQAEVDMVRLGENLMRQLATRVAEKQITMLLDTPDEAVLVRRSLSHLTVVFRNLVDNAEIYARWWQDHMADVRNSWRCSASHRG